MLSCTQGAGRALGSQRQSQEVVSIALAWVWGYLGLSSNPPLFPGPCDARTGRYWAGNVPPAFILTAPSSCHRAPQLSPAIWPSLGWEKEQKEQIYREKKKGYRLYL